METRLQYGSKVHPEDRAKYRLRNNPWCTLRMSIHESRHLQHSTKAHTGGRFTNSIAHEKTEGTVLSLSGVPGRAVCPR